MKGITMCADCAYYNMKTHKCTRGCTGEPDIENGDDVRFFTDCPLPNVAEVRHGRWENIDPSFAHVYCSECGAAADKHLAKRYKGCPFCLCVMDAPDINVGGKGGVDK